MRKPLPEKLAVRPTQEQIRKYISRDSSFCPIAQQLRQRFGDCVLGVDYEEISFIDKYNNILVYTTDTQKDAELLAYFIQAVDSARARERIGENIKSSWICLHLNQVIEE